ncbi:[protein-PII] uridylyltransferase [Bartonella sp. HY329]|uniref:[protein-PII] uridylyltransferase n=1 Tax=unclassified Bartonella TaxID=2645622 RepID=UPI0021C81F59|nr:MULTISPECIES: [protein-PII] uridylyltransferase [unclassified Bartonella]UXM94039.1 [protein-PII] uridylyltransferase [Bartonella sp. HY329]UXN08361.1 [protein-PII] uridylyltransferase [Bartonella sp. HY328]
MVKLANIEDIVNSSELKKRLYEVVCNDKSNCTDMQKREAVRCELKQALVAGQKGCEIQLLLDGHGRLCAKRLSLLIDIVIDALYDVVIKKIFKLQNPSNGERIALIAVGGYGRGTLAPSSDIDLLFLLPYKQTPWGEQVMEFILYMLWDIGLKVGHATRNIDETIRMAREDMTVRTALLEMRFLNGNQPLFQQLSDRFNTEIVKGTATQFIRAKLIERDERHKKAGQTRYLVEPNVKESKGGQRDLQTLYWITRYFYEVKTPEQLVKIGVLSRQEANIFKKADDFLWAVRCHMHFLAGKANERLSFDIQRDIAHRLGYTAHPGQEDVERFMKHYFLVAKQVGDLTRIISAALEEDHAKAVPGINQIFLTFSKRKKKIKGSDDFIIDHQRINIAHSDVFSTDPVNLIRIFQIADQYGFELHPHAMQQMTRSLKLITNEVRENKIANGLFLDVLTSPRNPSLMLRRMNESGVLGKFIPDFGKIVAMMQFSMYHHYTVDEHLLLCLYYLSEIYKGNNLAEHPLATSLIPQLKDERRLLYIAVFLHDIAKGRLEDHSIAGEKIARKLCKRFGLSATDCETVAWLIREHLTMSIVAQSRDLNDRKTINDFADVVQTMDRLKLLLILTICDIKGVGPGVWNGWKGQLLRTLYHETEIVLTGGFSKETRFERILEARAELAAALRDWEEEKLNAYIELLYPNYWLTVSLEDKIRHANFITQADENKQSFAFMAKLHNFEAVTELTILAPDHPRLLSIITGACAAAGANIVDAQIFTTSDGRALDTILLSREFELASDEERRAQKIADAISSLLRGEARLTEFIAARAKPKKMANAFSVAPRIEINNTLSDKFSVIEVKGLDRPGLLSELTGTISNLSLDIASAHITTFGEKIMDTFYVTDLVGHKIDNISRQKTIKRKLNQLFGNENS